MRPGGGVAKPAQLTRHQQRRFRAGKAPKLTEPPRTAWQRLGDDLVPVGGFLAGKLVSHAAAGAALGAVGSTLPLSGRVQAFAQVAAGLLVIAGDPQPTRA